MLKLKALSRVLLVSVFAISGYKYSNLMKIEAKNARKALAQSAPPPPTEALLETRNSKPRPTLVTVHQDDSIYQKHWGHSAPVVIESHKLVFFPVAKVGCTVWKQLFRRMMGFQDWKTFPDPHNPYDNGLKYLSDYPTHRATQIMNSPNWTKVIFIRDPKERLVSGYLDKAWKVNKLCCPRTTKEACDIPPIKTFADFVEVTQRTSCKDNIHWRPQSLRMEDRFFSRINFVGHMETAADDAKQLLERIGAWEEFGAHGWGGETGQIFRSKATIPHATSKNAHDAWARLSRYYTPELEAKVEEYYKKDYDLAKFNLPRRKIDF